MLKGLPKKFQMAFRTARGALTQAMACRALLVVLLAGGAQADDVGGALEADDECSMETAGENCALEALQRQGQRRGMLLPGHRQSPKAHPRVRSHRCHCARA